MDHPLRQFRTTHGLSIEEMAKRLDVSTATVSRIENGKQNIPLDLMGKIKAETEDRVTPNDLLQFVSELASPQAGAAE